MRCIEIPLKSDSSRIQLHLTSYNNSIECQSVLKTEDPFFTSFSDKKVLINLKDLLGSHF